MKNFVRKTLVAVTVFSLMTLGIIIAGCSGGGGSGVVSKEVVSGNASVGAPLSGQVSLKDASSTPEVRTTVIGDGGSFSIDVTGMQAPFILEATGNAAGSNYTMHSFADGAGTANINPLSDAIVASAAGDNDASDSYNHSDKDKLHKIRTNIQATVAALLAKLQPLLQRYNAEHTDPITSHYISNHIGMDDMFDHMKITVKNGILSIIYTKTGAVVFTGTLSDIANGVFNGGALPPPAAVPAAPAGVIATAGAGQVNVAWTSVTDATSYNVYYATASGVTTATGTKVPVTTNSYLQTGLTAGTSYYYVVTALNSAGESIASTQVSATVNSAPPVTTVPAAPTGVSAVGGTNQVTLSWGLVASAVSYNVYYATTSGVTTAIGTKIANATSPAVLTGLTAATAYYYIVTAVNSAGEGAASVQVAATTLSDVPTQTVPSAPAGVTAVGGANQATITWPAVTGAASYNVYRSTTTGVTTTSGTKITAVNSPYTNSGLSAGTTYYFIVTAVNSVGESTASTQVSATTSPATVAVPVAPTGVTATGGATQVSISWSTVSGATSYNIYYATTTGVTNTSGTKITNATTPFTQTGLAAGTTYYFIVTAVNSAGESIASAEATAATNPAATPACGSCHTIPPATGQHAFHVNTQGFSCAICHGTGYSPTTVNAATHNNGVVNLVSTIGFNAATSTCATPGCHGSRAW
jgi:predicted phage tail protein